MTRRILTAATTIALGLTTAVALAQRQPAGQADKTRAGGGASAASRNDKAQNARATFEVYKDKSGEYRWRLRATNTQILAMAAQGYSDKRSCLSAIESIKRDVADAPVEEKDQAAAGASDTTAKPAGAGAKTGSDKSAK